MTARSTLPRIPKTDSENEALLVRIDELFDAQPNTPEGDELDLLVLLVERYEERAFPIELPDPIAAIRFRMEQRNLKPKDLAPLLGGKGRVSEVLHGRRPLSLKMIRNLVTHLGIPAESLLREIPRRGQSDTENHPA